MDEKTAKGPGSQMPAPAIQSEINRKLHCLARPAYLGVSTLAERPRDVEAEVGGQRLADAKIRRSKIKKSKRSGPESESGGSRPAGSGPEREDK